MLLKFFAADIVKLICKKFCWIMCYVLTVSIWCPIEEERLKTTFSAYFTVLLSKGQKCSKAKIMRCVRRRCIDRTPIPKLRSGSFNLENAPRPRRPLDADVDKIKSLVDRNQNNSSRDCRIESIKRDRSQAHQTSNINFQAWHMGSSYSYRTKFTSSH